MYLQDRLTAGHPQRLLEAEVELFLLLWIFNEERLSGQEATSFSTLQAKTRGRLSVCFRSRRSEMNAHAADLLQPVSGDDGDPFGQSTQELDGPANLVGHQAGHVCHALCHAAS